MMLDSTAAALAAECAGCARPATGRGSYVDPMEDHVSMAALAARQAKQAVQLARRTIAVELACAAQALDFQGPELASPATRELHAAAREILPFVSEDRPIDTDPLTALL
jgi:histidine ammonia-lyase